MEDRLNEVCKDVAVLRSESDTLKNCYESLTRDVKEIKEKLLNRPSWFVATLITLLTTTCVSLIIYIVTNK